MALMTFQRALEESQTGERTVLLGNGFSICADPIFSYNNLLQYAALTNEMRSLFEREDTCDFEIIISRLENTYGFLKMYTMDYPELLGRLDSDSRSLREIFAQVISGYHPTHKKVFQPKDVSSGYPTRSCFTFLSNFKKIFTTNYDLILYWACTLSRDKMYTPHSISIPHDDGFGKFGDDLLWLGDRPSRKQEIFYLHGSLFFYQDKEYFYKQEAKDNHDLLSVVSKSIINKKMMPLVVMEGSTENKILKISEHEYLIDAYDHLGRIDGSLFIFGHSLNPNDGHILSKIKNSDFKKIFISVFNESMESKIMDRAHVAFCHPKKERRLFFYDSNSANVWM